MGRQFNYSYLEGATLAATLLELSNNSSGVSLPYFVSGAKFLPTCIAQATLTHHGLNVSWALKGGLVLQRILNCSTLFSNFSILGTAGSGYRLGFEIFLFRNKALNYHSMPFTVLPSLIFIEFASNFASTAFSIWFPIITVACLGVNRTLLSKISHDDGLYVIAILLKGGPYFVNIGHIMASDRWWSSCL
jgi:hypothetical protein